MGQWTTKYRIYPYTDLYFWGEQGISLLTTDHVIETAVLDALKRYYQQHSILKVAHDAFEERHIRDKGIGLVAKRALSKGELIILEPPSLLVHLGIRQDVLDQPDWICRELQ